MQIVPFSDACSTDLRGDAVYHVNGGAKLVHPGGAKLVHLTLCENGGDKLVHGSGGISQLRAE